MRWTEEEYHDLFIQKANELESKRMNTFEKEAYQKRTVFLCGTSTIGLRWYSFLFWFLGYNTQNHDLDDCDYIYMIPGWLNSLVAFREFKEAERLGIKLLNDSPRNLDRWASVKMMREYEEKNPLILLGSEVLLINILKGLSDV